MLEYVNSTCLTIVTASFEVCKTRWFMYMQLVFPWTVKAGSNKPNRYDMHCAAFCPWHCGHVASHDRWPVNRLHANFTQMYWEGIRCRRTHVTAVPSLADTRQCVANVGSSIWHSCKGQAFQQQTCQLFNWTHLCFSVLMLSRKAARILQTFVWHPLNHADSNRAT